MKINQTLALGASLLLLTACGGGGGDNTPTPTPTNTPTPNRPSNNVSGSYQGRALVVPAGSKANASNSQNVGGDSLTVLSVAGKQIPLQLNNISSGAMTHVQGSIVGSGIKLFSVSGSHYRYSKFGYINQDGADYIFSHGQRTAQMPSSGTARYVGDATLGRDGQAVLGVSDFSADFGRKTLAGTITPLRSGVIKALDINANISGNSFSTAAGAAVSSSGHFYGSQAEELGGIFVDSNQQLAGSFGGRKQ